MPVDIVPDHGIIPETRRRAIRHLPRTEIVAEPDIVDEVVRIPAALVAALNEKCAALVSDHRIGGVEEPTHHVSVKQAVDAFLDLRRSLSSIGVVVQVAARDGISTRLKSRYIPRLPDRRSSDLERRSVYAV